MRILDSFTELTAELTARRRQYEYYRDRLLTFKDGGHAVRSRCHHWPYSLMDILTKLRTKEMPGLYELLISAKKAI